MLRAIQPHRDGTEHRLACCFGTSDKVFAIRSLKCVICRWAALLPWYVVS
jgi:hypothetical protein